MKDQEKPKNSRWYRLGFDNENIPQKSIHSKDSSIHSKYTPTKNLLKSPETRLNIPALKDKVVPVEQLRKQNESRNFSDVGHKSELINYNNKETSINRGIYGNKLNTSVISLKGNNHLQSNEIFKNNHQDNQNQSFSNRKSNVEILFQKNNENKTSTTQYQKQTNKNVHKSVEQMHKDFLLILNSMEKDLNNERINIIKMLDEKQRIFAHTKQKIMSAFANKQKQIKRQEPNSIVAEDYCSKEEQKNTLARVTSQKIFTRAQKQKQKNMYHKVEASHKSKQQKSQCARSSGSKAKSEYRSNFDVIFDTINQMKSELEVIERTDRVPLHLEYETRYKQQKYRTTKDQKQNENRRLNFMLEMPPVYTRQFGIEQGKFNSKKYDPYNI